MSIGSAYIVVSDHTRITLAYFRLRLRLTNGTKLAGKIVCNGFKERADFADIIGEGVFPGEGRRRSGQWLEAGKCA
jgi:hypothetical protein